MKKLLLCLLLGVSALAQPAKAASITVDPALTDAHTLVFDVEWNPFPPADYEDFWSAVTDAGTYLGPRQIITLDYPGTGNVVAVYVGGGTEGLGRIRGLAIYLNSTRTGWDSLYDTEGAGLPTSITLSPTGHGARIVYSADASGLINGLIAKVNGLSIKTATKTSLVAKLNAALKALSLGDTATACARMQDFIDLCVAQAGKKQITTTMSGDLIADAIGIQTALGCP